MSGGVSFLFSRVSLSLLFYHVIFCVDFFIRTIYTGVRSHVECTIAGAAVEAPRLRSQQTFASQLPRNDYLCTSLTRAPNNLLDNPCRRETRGETACIT